MKSARLATGFTLIEMLLAISILSVVAAALAAWLGAEADALTRRVELSSGSAEQRWIRVLRDDLFAHQGVDVVDERTLLLHTCHAIPGDGQPGWREVRWTQSESGGAFLTRSSPDSKHRTPLVDVRFVSEVMADDESGERRILWLEARGGRYALGLFEPEPES